MLKIKIIYSIIIALSLPLYALGNDIDTSNLNPATVLIFDNIPPYVRSAFPFPKVEQKDSRSQVTIFDNFYEHAFNPNPLRSDTIVFYQQQEHIVISFLYAMTREPMTYIINKGDTIYFSFVNGIPYAKNSQTLKNTYLNYDYDRLLATKNMEYYTMYEIYRNPTNVAKDLNDVINNSRVIKQNYYKQARNFLDNELSFLDSFKELGEQEPGIFNFIQDKMAYQIALLDFEQHQLKADSLDAMLAFNKQKTVSSSFSYFLPFLEHVADSIIVKKAKFIIYKTGSDIDYRDVYDRTMEWPAVSDFYKKHLLYGYLKKIGKIFSASDLQVYLLKFSLFSNDTLLVNKITDEFIIGANTGILAKGSLYAADAKNNKFSLETLLAENRGKVVYRFLGELVCTVQTRNEKCAETSRGIQWQRCSFFIFFT